MAYFHPLELDIFKFRAPSWAPPDEDNNDEPIVTKAIKGEAPHTLVFPVRLLIKNPRRKRPSQSICHTQLHWQRGHIVAAQ